MLGQSNDLTIVAIGSCGDANGKRVSLPVTSWDRFASSAYAENISGHSHRALLAQKYLNSQKSAFRALEKLSEVLPVSGDTQRQCLVLEVMCAGRDNGEASCPRESGHKSKLAYLLSGGQEA